MGERDQPSWSFSCQPWKNGEPKLCAGHPGAGPDPGPAESGEHEQVGVGGDWVVGLLLRPCGRQDHLAMRTMPLLLKSPLHRQTAHRDPSSRLHPSVSLLWENVQDKECPSRTRYESPHRPSPQFKPEQPELANAEQPDKSSDEPRRFYAGFFLPEFTFKTDITLYQYAGPVPRDWWADDEEASATTASSTSRRGAWTTDSDAARLKLWRGGVQDHLELRPVQLLQQAAVHGDHNHCYDHWNNFLFHSRWSNTLRPILPVLSTSALSVTRSSKRGMPWERTWSRSTSQKWCSRLSGWGATTRATTPAQAIAQLLRVQWEEVEVGVCNSSHNSNSSSSNSTGQGKSERRWFARCQLRWTSSWTGRWRSWWSPTTTPPSAKLRGSVHNAISPPRSGQLWRSTLRHISPDSSTSALTARRLARRGTLCACTRSVRTTSTTLRTKRDPTPLSTRPPRSATSLNLNSRTATTANRAATTGAATKTILKTTNNNSSRACSLWWRRERFRLRTLRSLWCTSQNLQSSPKCLDRASWTIRWSDVRCTAIRWWWAILWSELLHPTYSCLTTFSYLSTMHQVWQLCGVVWAGSDNLRTHMHHHHRHHLHNTTIPLCLHQHCWKHAFSFVFYQSLTLDFYATMAVMQWWYFKKNIF